MIELPLPGAPSETLDVLCVGAHPDDIEIGCGGTMLMLLRRRRVRVRWVVFSGTPERAAEARGSAERFLGGAEAADVEVYDFRDGYFPTLRAEIKAVFEGLKERNGPDLVFTHDENDLHQDHRVLGSLSRETFRDHLLLGYEIPKYDGGLRSPNVFVPLDADARERKLELLLEAFPSQRTKRWFDRALFEGLMRLRGVECAAPTRYAEGFQVRKIALTP